MDKDMKEQKRNLLYLFMLIVFFCLFVLLSLLNETLGMLMFGIWTFYAILGNNNYIVEQRNEEKRQSKCELLNYDGVEKNLQKQDKNRQYKSKWHLLTVALTFLMMYFASLISLELGMVIFGALIIYLLIV